jgi:hypothetical protein
MKFFRILAIFSLFLIIINSLSKAQEPRRVRMQVPQSGGYRMLTEAGATVIPFEFISKHVVIPVEMNGKTLKLILDTGMPFDGALLFGSEKVDGLGLQYIGKAPVKGAGGSMIESDMTMGVTFKVQDVEFSNQMVIVMPQDSTRSNHMEGKDGVIGQTLFGRFVVGIDHDRMEITLTEPNRFEYAGAGLEFPVRIDRYPFLTCDAEIRSGQKIPLELVIDTGNGAALSLNVGFQDGLVLPEKVIEYHTRSVGHEILRLTGRIDRLHIGPYVLRNLLSSFRTSNHEPAHPWEKSGALGQGVLRRFNTVIDYTGKRIILEPNGHFDEPSEFNMAGIQLIRATGGSFRITRIIPGSPVEESGVKVGDCILGINGKPTDQLTADDVEGLLREEGHEVDLDIRRGDDRMNVRLTLRRLI